MPSAHVGRYRGWASMPPVEGHVPPGTFRVVAIHGPETVRTFDPPLPKTGHVPSGVTGRCLMSLVTEYLEARGVPYEVIHHDPSVSSLEEASAVHLDADHVLKAVVIATQSGRAVAVIPASGRLDMHLVREALADRSAYLATEDELQSEYPSIELGGAPVLGWLLDAETLVDPCVLERDTVVFAAGTRTESVRVQTRDLFRGEHVAFVPLVAEPETAEMSEP